MGFDKYSKETSLEEMGETQEQQETVAPVTEPVPETVVEAAPEATEPVTEPAPEATEPVAPVEPEADAVPETDVKKEGE
jgi:hypothetical protein